MRPTRRRAPLHAFRPFASSAFALLAAGVGVRTGVTACASTPTSAAAPIPGATGTKQTTVRVDGGTTQGSYQTQLTHDDYATYTDLAVTADRAFAVLAIVYEQLGLKVNTAVTEARTLGVNAARVRRVGNDPMSRFLSCGSDVTGTPIANSYAVTLTVMSRVTPSGTSGSVLSTQVIGTAQPMAVSGTVVNCQSTGLLEDRIAKTAQLRSAGAS